MPPILHLSFPLLYLLNIVETALVLYALIQADALPATRRGWGLLAAPPIIAACLLTTFPRLVASLLLLVFSAACYRVRGSDYLHLSTGSRPIKLAIGAFPVALATAVLLWSATGAGPLDAVSPLLPLPLLAVFLLVWLLTAAADSLPHAAFQGSVGAVEFLGMAALGLCDLFPAALAVLLGFKAGDLALHATLVVMLAGLASAVAYWYGNRVASDVSGIRQGPELGELMNGASRALYFVVLFGLGVFA